MTTRRSEKAYPDYCAQPVTRAKYLVRHPSFSLVTDTPGPACVIVDVRMQGLNGMDLQTALIQRRREEQLVFITGHGDISMCAQAMKAGAVDFLPKPFQDTELLECVERALSRSAEQRRHEAEKAEALRLLDSLTPREFEMMQLVATGMLNKQIAGELGTAKRPLKFTAAA